MPTSTWIQFNLPLSTTTSTPHSNLNSSPASLGLGLGLGYGKTKTGSEGSIGATEISPTNCVSVEDGNLRASLVITEEDLPVSRIVTVEGVESDDQHSTRPSSPVSLYRRGSSSCALTPTLAAQNEPPAYSRTSGVTSSEGRAKEGGGLSEGIPRVVRGLSWMGGHAQKPCRGSGLEEEARGASGEKCQLENSDRPSPTNGSRIPGKHLGITTCSDDSQTRSQLLSRSGNSNSSFVVLFSVFSVTNPASCFNRRRSCPCEQSQ